MHSCAADIMIRDFPFVDSDATVAAAASHVENSGLPALPVVNPDRTVFGLLTPMNLAHFYRRSANKPHAVHAWEICETRPLTVPGNAALADLADMLRETIRPCVLVVDNDHRVIGIVTRERLLDYATLGAGPPPRSRRPSNEHRPSQH